MTSRSENPVKASAPSQLKKDINQAGKALQALTSSLERIETSLTEAETALINERSLKKELSLVQRDHKSIQEAYQKVQNDREQEKASFADSTLKLTEEYNIRVDRVKSECDLKLRENQARKEETESQWKQQVDSEKAETQRLKGMESHIRRELESQLRKAKEGWKKTEEQLQNDLKQRDCQILELSNKNTASIQELNDLETILRGHEKEIQRLGSRLAALEAFPPQKDKPEDVIAKVQKSLRDFCVWCVESAETLPGWNQFPDGIRNEYLPRLYSSESDSGRYVFVAAIQHSICKAIKQTFLPFGPCADQRLRDISEALFRKNLSHEAIWRLMTINAILGDQQMVNEYTENLREVATSLLSSWKPFPGESQRKETLDKLTRLLVESATVSLELQKIRRRMDVSTDVVSDYFDSDSEEELHKVPGGYALPDSTAPILCLFPAFFWTASSAANSQPTLIRKGTAMFRDSPPLLAALNDEQEIRSPRLSNKKRLAT